MELQPDCAGSTPVPALPPRVDAKAIVRDRLVARRQRIRRVRRLVAAAAVASFAALWSVLYVQLASGHDPALSVNTATVTAATDPTSTTSYATAVANAHAKRHQLALRRRAARSAAKAPPAAAAAATAATAAQVSSATTAPTTPATTTSTASTAPWTPAALTTRQS